MIHAIGSYSHGDTRQLMSFQTRGTGVRVPDELLNEGDTSGIRHCPRQIDWPEEVIFIYPQIIIRSATHRVQRVFPL